MIYNRTNPSSLIERYRGIELKLFIDAFKARGIWNSHRVVNLFFFSSCTTQVDDRGRQRARGFSISQAFLEFDRDLSLPECLKRELDGEIRP